jgi:hypothetical protein
MKPTKQEVKDVLDDPSLEDLPDGAYWSVVHERLDLEYGDVFDYIAEDPQFFEYEGKYEEEKEN